MKIPRLLWLAVCVAAPLHAQQSEPPAATPPPQPSPPYVKASAESSQWLIVYSQGDPAAASAKPSPHAPPMDTRAGLAKKTVVVTKNPGILSETTALQNGAVTRRIRTPAMFVTQLSGSSEWIPSTGSQNGFNETDYSKSDFAGFDWLSAKNYVGVQTVTNRPCFVFHDKVVTADPQELDLIRTSIDKARSNWEWEKQKAASSATPTSTAGKSKTGKQKSPAASPTPRPDDSSPPAFDIKNYLREVTAFIDVETGLPAMLTYQTQDKVLETRTYTFMPAPPTPLTLPPETQALMDNRQAHLKRLASAAAAP